MGSMPLCLRFGRLIVDNACNITKIVQPAVRLNNSMCLKPWRAPDADFRRTLMNFTSSEGRNPVKETKNETSPSSEGKSNTQAVGNETFSEQDLKKQIEELTQQVVSLTNQSDDYLDKYKRALAENENMRQRYLKQIEDSKLFAIQGFCKDLLEVSDVLSRATECVPKEEISDKNPHLRTLFEGLNMTQAELKKVFKRHGLIEVNPIDEKFNPNLHEALFEKEIEGKEPGTIISVSKVGYKLHERIIRPALVGITKM